MNENTSQLSKEDITAFSQLAGQQQIIRKIKVGDLDIILSAADNQVLDETSFTGLDIAIYAEQASISGKLTANNITLATDVLVLGQNAALDTSGDDGSPITAPAINKPGQKGNSGNPGGHVYLYVNTFSLDASPLGIKTNGGKGGNGQVSLDNTGGKGGNGGNGGDVVIIYSNRYLMALNYLKEIASIFQNPSVQNNNQTNLVSYTDAFCAIVTTLYPTETSREKTKISDSLTLSDGIKMLISFSNNFDTNNPNNLPNELESLILDFVSMFQFLNDEFKNDYLKQQLNASGGGQGVGGNGNGGADNGALGVIGNDGEVIKEGFMTSQNLIDGLLGPSFYNLSSPFLFLHPNQLQMVLEKARLQILFSDPSTAAGVISIQGAKDILNSLTSKTSYFSTIQEDDMISQLYLKNEQLIGCQNSIEIFNQVYNEATQLSNQLIHGLDPYGHNYNYVPRGTYQMYKSALNQMIDSFIEIESAYLNYSKELNEEEAKISYLTNRTSQLNTLESQSKRNISVLVGEISQSIDLVELFTAQLTPYIGMINDDITQIESSIKDSFDFDVKQFIGALTAIAAAPKNALVWGKQTSLILYSGITNIKNDQGINVKKSYLINGVKQISGAINGQMLAEGFNQLNSGIIQLDDPGGNKIIVDENQLMTLLDKFYSKFPSEINNLKNTFKKYIDLIQKRNSEVVKYNQLLIMAEKELLALNKAKLLVTSINQSKFNSTDASLPEVSSIMAYIYNYSRSELLVQLYRASKAFNFWSVDNSNILENTLNGQSPESVDSYLLQGVNLALEAAFQKSPGTFSSPSGTFKDDSALKITLDAFELGLLKTTNSTTISIPVPNEGAFYGRADVRLTQVSVAIELNSKPTNTQQVLINVVQLGKETIQNPENQKWYNFVHSPVIVQCGFNTESGAITPASLVSTNSNNNQQFQLANIGPYATWSIQIDPKENVGFDMSQIKTVTLNFEGTFYDTIISQDINQNIKTNSFQKQKYMSTAINESETVIFPNFSAMSTAMEGENTTNGWDVVCSYNLTKLNALLSEKYKKGKLVASVPNVKIWDWVLDFNGLNMTTYDFQLSEPILNFNLDERATLSMPISKITSSTQGVVVSKVGPVSNPAKYALQTWYSVSDGTYTVLPDQSKIAVGDCAMYQNNWYKITTILPPKVGPALTGSHSLIGSIPISAILGNNQIYNKGTVVVFKSSSPSTAHIVLHFSNKAANPATFKIEPALNDNFNQEAKLLSSICNYFSDQVNDIDYVLNSVSPAKSPSGETMITPKSFVFSTISTGGTTGVLSTYIETTQNNGQGQIGPIFTVKGQRSSPIPTGNTASMIFSQSFIQNILLKNQLIKSLTDCSVTFTTLTSGVQANIYASDINIDIQIPQTQTNQTTSSNKSGSTITTYYVKIIKDILSSMDYPLKLKILGNQISLEWNINQAGFNYETGVDTTDGFHNSGIQWYNNSDHKININIGSSPTAPSLLTLDSSDNINISPILAFDQKTYAASVTPQPGHKSCWVKFWTGDATAKIHSALQSALANFAPKIKLTFNGINYFATTNILFPGGNIFEVDTAAGLQVPQDLIILGNINSTPKESI